MIDATILSVFLVLPLVGALLAWLLPARPNAQKTVSISVSLGLLAAATLLLVHAITAQKAGFVLRERIPLLSEWGIAWHVGVDGLSLAMLFLSALVQFAASVVAAPATRVRGYHSLAQLLFVGVNGTFLALDMVFFYTFWEVMLIPMFFLIAIWGGEDRKRAAVKFFLYTMGGSVLMLVTILVLHFQVPVRGVTIPVRAAEAREQMTVGHDGEAYLYDLPLLAADSSGATVSVQAAQLAKGTPRQLFVKVGRDFDLLHWKLLAPYWANLHVFGFALAPVALGFLFVAFAVKVPSFPLHLWLPHAHVQAPTAISVVLAGILLKLGVYGLMRVAWPLFPIAALQGASLFAWIGVISIVWGAFAALGQTDLKRLVAYSSISHMGFCVLGLASASSQGISGAAFQCVSHGLSASLLFLLVGCLYDRAHHRRVDGFGGMAQILPKFSALFLFAAMVGVGLPGLAGFVGELSSLLGAWTNSATRVAGWVAASGVVLSAAYLLWTVKRVLYGPVVHPEQKAFADLTVVELSALLPLAFLSLLLGVWPGLLQAALGPVSASLSGHLAWVAGLR
jgi:NADH-quinone oxidoreductase subunit M